MIQVIKKMLLSVLDNIDAGNSNMTEEEGMEVIEIIRQFTDRSSRMSKYSACKYLNVSRATFDRLVKDGKLPKGEHSVGFKELSWDKKTLEVYLKNNKGD